jgi:hypothetical protein
MDTHEVDIAFIFNGRLPLDTNSNPKVGSVYGLVLSSAQLRCFVLDPTAICGDISSLRVTMVVPWIRRCFSLIV